MSEVATFDSQIAEFWFKKSPYRTHESQEVLRQNGFETGFWPDPAMPQSGVKNKKPRTGRGFRQLTFAYSQLEVNVPAVQAGFEASVPTNIHRVNVINHRQTLISSFTPKPGATENEGTSRSYSVAFNEVNFRICVCKRLFPRIYFQIQINRA